MPFAVVLLDSYPFVVLAAAAGVVANVGAVAVNVVAKWTVDGCKGATFDFGWLAGCCGLRSWRPGRWSERLNSAVVVGFAAPSASAKSATPIGESNSALPMAGFGYGNDATRFAGRSRWRHRD